MIEILITQLSQTSMLVSIGLMIALYSFIIIKWSQWLQHKSSLTHYQGIQRVHECLAVGLSDLWNDLSNNLTRKNIWERRFLFFMIILHTLIIYNNKHIYYEYLTKINDFILLESLDGKGSTTISFFKIN